MVVAEALTGLVKDAADEIASTEGMLDRNEESESLAGFGKVHLVGDTGDDSRVSGFGRGVRSVSDTCSFPNGFCSIFTGEDSGDFFESEPFRPSVPFPSTAFLSDPFLFLVLISPCTAVIAVSASSVFSASLFVLRIDSLPRILLFRLCPILGDIDLFSS